MEIHFTTVAGCAASPSCCISPRSSSHPQRSIILPSAKCGVFLDADAEEDGGVEARRTVARHADDLVRRCYSGLRGTAFQTEVVRAIRALHPLDAVFLAAAILTGRAPS
jgi:hypothetical protein